jgi:hypothetical protein
MQDRITKRQPTKATVPDFMQQLEVVIDNSRAEEQKFLQSVDHDNDLQDLRLQLLDAADALRDAAMEHPLIQEQMSRLESDEKIDPAKAFIQTEIFIFMDNIQLFEQDFLDRLIDLRLKREWLWAIFQCRLWSHTKHESLLRAEDRFTTLFRG